MMRDKYKVSVLIPYKIKNNDVEVFLQKRTEDAKVAPGCFGFFGGKIEEQETPDEALKREIKEELDLSVEDYKFFKQYDFGNVLINVYISEVGEDFEGKISVNEGDYGKFFSGKEVFKEPKLAENANIILGDLFKK